VALKDGLVRADSVPLVFKALGCEALPRNAHVRVRITGIDLLTLDLHANLASRLDDAPTAAAADEGGDDDDGDNGAPLALAIDMAEAAEATEAPAAPGSTPAG
jgi:exoribonuclease II